MMGVYCKNCVNLKNDWCDKKHDSPYPEIVRDCQYFKAATNADRIRAMTDEELAELFASFDKWTEETDLPETKVYQKWLDWLKQEAEE